MSIKINKNRLEYWYNRYNKKQFRETDPVQIVHRFKNPADREIVGLLTASLAYGRVKNICNSVEDLLSRLDYSPAKFLRKQNPASITNACAGFRYRFTGEEEITSLLLGVRRALLHHDSLKKCFLFCYSSNHKTIIPALAGFVKGISAPAESIPHLLPSPTHGSACKRLMLFLRWMVRSDNIDMGEWKEVGKEKLILPIDTHMRKICQALDLTGRRQVDLKTATEATESFRKIRPDDPIRYDFALTRITMKEGIKGIENAT
jgi:uncharacterized protein (TIGR02757 family)